MEISTSSSVTSVWPN